MKRTDYNRVSKNYDENRQRQRIHADDALAKSLQNYSFSAPFRVLDLGCGTGTYLHTQKDAFTSEFDGGQIEWFGLDASQAMLEQARPKVPGADLQVGDVHSLPYPDGHFNFISCNFAFHHFEDKGKALDEIHRVTASGGTFKIWNIQPERMPGWWVYRYFPQACLEDSERFWGEQRLWLELEKRGFSVKIKSSRTLRRRAVQEIIEDIDRRDISELANLDDQDYLKGRAAVRALQSAAAEVRIPDEFAQLTCIAVKK